MLLFCCLPILNSATLKIATIKPKPIGYAFTPFESLCVLASADRNEVFAGILGALEVMKSQNTANKKTIFLWNGVTVFSIY